VEETTKGLQKFRDKHWRCEAMDDRDHRRCRNYWQGHEKGHQFRGGAHRIAKPSSDSDSEVDLFAAEFNISLNDESYIPRLWKEISALDGYDDATIKKRLAERARKCGMDKITSQRTCLSCLSNCPTNVLPCSKSGRQHSICESCIRRYAGPSNESSRASLKQCPLGCGPFTSPWTIRVKPTTAGPRVLALDG
jgi:hypothetical protein